MIGSGQPPLMTGDLKVHVRHHELQKIDLANGHSPFFFPL